MRPSKPRLPLPVDWRARTLHTVLVSQDSRDKFVITEAMRRYGVSLKALVAVLAALSVIGVVSNADAHRVLRLFVSGKDDDPPPMSGGSGENVVYVDFSKAGEAFIIVSLAAVVCGVAWLLLRNRKTSEAYVP